MLLMANHFDQFDVHGGYAFRILVVRLLRYLLLRLFLSPPLSTLAKGVVWPMASSMREEDWEVQLSALRWMD